MTDKEMIQYLDGELTKADEAITGLCGTIAGVPIERTVRRNMMLDSLVDLVERRSRLIRDMGSLVYGNKKAEDFPGYELFAEMSKREG